MGPTHTFTLKQAEAAAEARQLLWKGIASIDAKQARRIAQALEAARTITFAVAQRCTGTSRKRHLRRAGSAKAYKIVR